MITVLGLIHTTVGGVVKLLAEVLILLRQLGDLKTRLKIAVVVFVICLVLTFTGLPAIGSRMVGD